MKKIREIFSGNEGFTLIELLIVIVILGVLAAIAVPNLMGLQDSANVETVKTNMRTLLTEIEAYKVNNGKLPTTNEDLDSQAWESLKEMDTDGDITLTPSDLSNITGKEGEDEASYEYNLKAEVDDSDDSTVTITIEDGQLTVEGDGSGSDGGNKGDSGGKTKNNQIN